MITDRFCFRKGFTEVVSGVANNTHFHAENAIIAAAGMFHKTSLSKKIQKLYSKILSECLTSADRLYFLP